MINCALKSAARHQTVTLATALILTFATQAGADDVVMICNAADYEKRYYKLVKPIFGDNTVQQKVDGQWVNWCEKNCVEIEVYASGARKVSGFWSSRNKSYPDEEVEANRKYYIEIKSWLDFEFGQYERKGRVYTGEAKRKELKKAKIQGLGTYKCKIRETDGYLKKFKGTIEGVIQ